MTFQKFESFEAAKEAGVEYMLTVGRRQPMHVGHLATLKKIMENGVTPIIVIGSTNTATKQNGFADPRFDPVRNPLTIEQQHEQLRLALVGKEEGKDYIVIEAEDIGNLPKWSKKIARKLPPNTALHFIGKDEDKVDGMHEWERSGGFKDLGLPVFEDTPHQNIGIDLSARQLRSLDLRILTESQKSLFADYQYILQLALKSREKNELPESVPLTMLDISIAKLMEEKGVTADQIAGLDYNNLPQELQRLSQQTTTKTVPLKIASASLNQTGGDWHNNLQNIFDAIDRAIADGANLLCLEELTLTGYERGDDFFYSDNMKTREMLQLIADYAASKNPNLVVSVGHPWFFADKSIPDQVERLKNPLYNIENKNFNCQSLITGGKIVSMSAKTYLFSYERGYEGRHFMEWNLAAANSYENKYGKGRDGTIWMELPQMQLDGGTILPAEVIPFGDPVVQLRAGDDAVNLYHVICHGKWVGSRFEGQAEDNSDYEHDNPLAQKARDFSIGVGINPNASPPAPNKIDKHKELNSLASNHCAVFVDTDGVGSSGSTFAQFGTRLMYQNGEKISEGVRCSFQQVSYTSQIVEVPVSKYKGHEPHAIIAHSFAKDHSAPVQDGPAKWENNGRREFEEEMRTELLWMYDYLRKNKLPGIVQALSGGADSSYNAAKLPLMVQLGCKELGVEGFLESMPYLKFKDEALDISRKGGEEEAIKFICDKMLTSVYMGTDNSSLDTLRAAFTLMIGGTKNKESELYRQIDAQLIELIEGRTSDKEVTAYVKNLLALNASDPDVYNGIGGVFHYRNIQRLVEVYAEIYSGVNPGKMDTFREIQVREELAEILRARPDEVSRESLDARIDLVQTEFEEICGEVLSVAKPEHSIAYENFQARIRAVLIQAFANVENKIAISNPNLDEGRNSYATYAGDLHGGVISGNAHKNKARQLEHMGLLEEHGLEGLPKVDALHWANQNRPSAELQPKSSDGKVTQFDEDQLGRSFVQMDVIAHYMLYDRPREQNERKNNPIEVFSKCQGHDAFAGDSIETLHDRILLSYQKWAHAQFKIHASPIAMTFGRNIDHQSSLRTPNISAFHRQELAQMALHALNEMAIRDGSSFEELTDGQNFGVLKSRALIDDKFAQALTSKMWTPQANDGRKMKVATLYEHIKERGFDSIITPTKMSRVLDRVAEYRAGTGR